MLSLKHTRFQATFGPKKGLTDLPSEILDLILQYIYHSSGKYLLSIFPISRASREIRASAYSILFEKLTIRAHDDVIHKSSWDLLEYLSSRPHLLKLVRCLEVRTSVKGTVVAGSLDARSAQVGHKLSRRRLLECLTLMTGLRSLKIRYLTNLNLDILKQLQEVTTVEVFLELSYSESGYDSERCQRLSHILQSSYGWGCSLSLPSPHRLTDEKDMVKLVAAARKINALAWHEHGLLTQELIFRNQSISSLEELHISNSGKLSTVLPWPSLKRLHVEGDVGIRDFLSIPLAQLHSIEDLCLVASSPDAFHPHCLNATRQLPPDNLPFAQLPRLRRLQLFGVCPHLSVSHLTTKTLRSLSIILPEYQARINRLAEARPPSQIKWLAENLPFLEHLELQVGPLENLWHPTAIPGVEVNVAVYSILQTLTQIPNLKILRLFPPYVPRNASHDCLNARQPLSDEQAVRVFRHLHSQRPGLQILSIAATFHLLRGFSPMSWTVRDAGNGKTNVITQQSGKDYELQQVWIGERRMTMKNKRHAYRKPYLADLGDGWVFPLTDPR